MEGEPVALSSAGPGTEAFAGGTAGDCIGLEGGANQGALALTGHEADVLTNYLSLQSLDIFWMRKLWLAI